mgnify:CR=1 FL=1
MLNFYIIGDIGNTDIKICVYKNKNIVKKIRLSTNKVNLKYLRKNLTKNKIIIGMGAGAISKWMARLKFSL